MLRERLAIVRAVAIAVTLIAAAGPACDSGTGTGPERDEDPNLPGIFVPPQGRKHLGYTFSPSRSPKPFCDGVASSDNPVGSAAVVDVPTPEPDVENSCYSSNPPSSGWHLASQANVDLGNGVILNRIPPDPDVYPRDVKIPREAIPHILEHAGVYVGYHCAEGDAECEEIVQQLEDIVNDRLDAHGDRVVMARDTDLPEDAIGLSSWTRVDVFQYRKLTEERVVDFIDTHSCRFDPEGFC
jgi:hypothetical protein